MAGNGHRFHLRHTYCDSMVKHPFTRRCGWFHHRRRFTAVTPKNQLSGAANRTSLVVVGRDTWVGAPPART